MTPELYWLALTATMTGLFWMPYILDRAVRRGVPGAFLTPKMEAAPVEAEWAQRAKRAHLNAVESIGPFAALVLVAQFSGASNSVTALGAAIYFWGRLGHYVTYTLGIPYLRTLTWTAALIGELMIAWQILAR